MGVFCLTLKILRMIMKKLYCKKCGKLVGIIETGSKLSKGMVCICSDCDNPNHKPIKHDNIDSTMDDLFKIFGMDK